MLLKLPIRKELPNFPLHRLSWAVHNLERHFHGSCLDREEFLRSGEYNPASWKPSMRQSLLGQDRSTDQLSSRVSSADPQWSPALATSWLSWQKIAIKLWENYCIFSHDCTDRWQWPLPRLSCSLLGWQRAAWHHPIPKPAGNSWMGDATQQKFCFFICFLKPEEMTRRDLKMGWEMIITAARKFRKGTCVASAVAIFVCVILIWSFLTSTT